jgi:hypothetical protein
LTLDGDTETLMAGLESLALRREKKAGETESLEGPSAGRGADVLSHEQARLMVSSAIRRLTPCDRRVPLMEGDSMNM